MKYIPDQMKLVIYVGGTASGWPMQRLHQAIEELGKLGSLALGNWLGRERVFFLGRRDIDVTGSIAIGAEVWEREEERRSVREEIDRFVEALMKRMPEREE